jgi:hypothetical protein
MSMASGKRTPAGFPQLTNREASGLILFARQVSEYATGKGHPLAFDWYAFALAALGWKQRGDLFDMSTAQQVKVYAPSTELWSALQAMGSKLDELQVPFELVRDPAGTEGTYKRIAEDAWAFMQRESPADASAAIATSAARTKQTPAMPATPHRQTPARELPVASAPRRERDRESDSGGGIGTILLIGLLAYAFSDDD